MRATTFLFFMLFSWHTFAGYYVTVTSSTNPAKPVGFQSSCYLIPSMAVIGATGTAFTMADSITVVTPTTGSIKAHSTSGTLYSYEFNYGYCISQANSTNIPSYANGVIDPYISTDGTLITGSSSTAGPTTPIEVTATVVQSEIAFLDPEQAVGNSVQWFGFTAILWALAWGGRRVIDLFTHST